MDRRKLLLDYYEEFPFEHHPLWSAVIDGRLSLQAVLQAETQHWIRTKRGQRLRKKAVEQARGVNDQIFSRLNETYIEECTDARGENHLKLIERLLTIGGLRGEELAGARPTPGNSAAIAMYEEISNHGFGCHLIAAGAVEHYYSLLSPKIFAAYTAKYGMSEHQAETYRLHGPMDQEHAARAFDVIDEVVALHGWDSIELSVRDAFVATSLHYDGMLQAAEGCISYWNGSVS